MSDENSQKGASPSHVAYQVRENEGGKSFFNRVGSAFEHKDKQGFNLILDSMPVDGRVTLRTPQERLKTARNGNDKSRDAPEYER